MKKIVCLIPLYNEQEALGALFLRLGALFDSLCARYEMSALLVDDGSADGALRFCGSSMQGTDAFAICRFPAISGKRRQ